MTSRIDDRLNERRVEFGPYQWEGRYNHLYDSVKPYDDLRKLILDGDVNTKIFTMDKIVPLCSDLFSEEERRDLLNILKHQLADERMCDISSSTSYADNEDATTVSSSARYALSELEKLIPNDK